MDRGVKGFLIEFEDTVRDQWVAFIYASGWEKLPLDSANQFRGLEQHNGLNSRKCLEMVGSWLMEASMRRTYFRAGALSAAQGSNDLT